MQAIYEAGYWLPPRCDLLQRKLDLVQFDTAVNMGPKRAVEFLQKAIGCGVDGDFGPATERAVGSCDLGTAVIAYCNTREAYYERLAQKNPKLKVFLKGWMNRLNALRKEVGLPGYRGSSAARLRRRRLHRQDTRYRQGLSIRPLGDTLHSRLDGKHHGPRYLYSRHIQQTVAGGSPASVEAGIGGRR